MTFTIYKALYNWLKETTNKKHKQCPKNKNKEEIQLKTTKENRDF